MKTGDQKPPNQRKTRSTPIVPRSTRSRAHRGRSIPYLPSEILPNICKFLHGDRKSLLACCLTSKSFNQAASPLLWRTLSLTPWMTARNGRVVPHHVLREHGRSYCSSDEGSSIRNLRHVRKLALDYHHSQWCKQDSSSALHLPNLKTLQLNYNNHSRKVFTSFHTNESESKIPCPLFKALRPTNIVLRKSYCDFLELERQEYPTFLSNSVENLYLVPSIGISNSLPWNSLKTITLIQPPPEFKTWDYCPVSPGYGNDFTIDFIAGFSMDFESASLLLVGTPCDETWPHRSTKAHNFSVTQFREKFMAELNKQLNNYSSEADRPWTTERLKKRIDTIEFMTFEEWASKRDLWKDVFEGKEIDDWVESLKASTSSRGLCV